MLWLIPWWKSRLNLADPALLQFLSALDFAEPLAAGRAASFGALSRAKECKIGNSLSLFHESPEQKQRGSLEHFAG